MAIIERIAKILGYISMGLVVIMMVLTSADVIGRYLFNAPLKGAYELGLLVMVGVVFGSLAFTAVLKGHISIELLTHRLRPRAQAILNALGALIGIIVFSLIGWQGIDKIKYFIEFGYTSDMLRIPIYPAPIVLVVGSFILCLVLLGQFVGYIREIFKPKSSSVERSEKWTLL